ncbi:aminodeoxychorismate synthase component I [Gaetbulibacter saemankumensis]|uniref:aminodeoxychorismate synthase component I n=1 Tax=Gaetbulibacter saemankumensis TaxID=311208 RepID=UPI0006849154|nr:aminodeoxychorismate synthase component I [Gaetbulibacter saemankumensis]
MRAKQISIIEDPRRFKQQLLNWSQQFDDVVWLDSNNYAQNHSNYDAVLAVDAFTSIQTDYFDAFNQLKDYQTRVNDWIFGYLTYDLKNDVENLKSENYDGLGFPDLYFFQPKRLFFFKGNEVEIQYLNCVKDELNSDLNEIQKVDEMKSHSTHQEVKIKLRIHKDEYFDKIKAMLQHIHYGDIYEANFCQEFYAENIILQPLDIYNKLNSISNAPFATYLKQGDKYLMSASPERYIKKEGTKVVSQPIKGTAKRSKNKSEDSLLKRTLKSNEKERSENIMIVDLVRNDLSKLAVRGSVKVDELCEIYTFDQVHQMISTVSCEVNLETHPVDIIMATFPMGSMTGAPKISAMKIIENLEETKRGLYSGAVGYFSSEGDFDFNVVIRSILYNQTKQYVSFSVGGAITAKSDPLSEYEECLIKAKAMREVLES